MPLETDLPQKAVLWTRAGYDKRGEPRHSDPIEIDVRWENSSNELLMEDGTPFVSSANVMVDRVIPLESLMWLGELEDLPEGALLTDETIQIVSLFSDTPDIKGQEHQRNVVLRKWKEEEPNTD